MIVLLNLLVITSSPQNKSNGRKRYCPDLFTKYLSFLTLIWENQGLLYLHLRKFGFEKN